MEKCEPITTEPVNPPPYNSKQEYEDKAKTNSAQNDTANVVQQTTQDQTAITIVPQTVIAHATTNTSLCECDGTWWGFCCLSLWFIGIGSLVADHKIHGSVTWTGGGLGVMGILKWTWIILFIFGFMISGPIVATAQLILTIIFLQTQRRHFMNRQLFSGSYPNNEDC